ncbi:hypothetical protein [Mucilaginibacter rubeus]|uniref:Uncharacterized protein n=1 Tax=Mucilaginibacter rubeus TaxID=2027860 RepID=A0A5C1I6F2_9SPHI|nr:hypothetical protein [Mucilaginibacter rubeus]QEM13444.1 hypothetical protein DEO27_026690 [Mucilaginibacter rubeus]
MDYSPANKTTCNNFSHPAIMPIPARVIAQISNVSESYVKKLRVGNREDNSETAKRVKQADTLMADGFEYLVNEVKSLINKEDI